MTSPTQLEGSLIFPFLYRSPHMQCMPFWLFVENLYGGILGCGRDRGARTVPARSIWLMLCSRDLFASRPLPHLGPRVCPTPWLPGPGLCHHILGSGCVKQSLCCHSKRSRGKFSAVVVYSGDYTQDVRDQDVPSGLEPGPGLEVVHDGLYLVLRNHVDGMSRTYAIVLVENLLAFCVRRDNPIVCS